MDFLHLYSSCPLYHWFFSMPQGRQIFTEPFSDNPPYQGCSVRHGVPIIIISPSLLAFSMWSLCHLLCRNCSISPHFFFRRNCCICRCRFCVQGGRWVQSLTMMPSWTALLVRYFKHHWFSISTKRITGIPSHSYLRIKWNNTLWWEGLIKFIHHYSANSEIHKMTLFWKEGKSPQDKLLLSLHINLKEVKGF